MRQHSMSAEAKSNFNKLLSVSILCAFGILGVTFGTEIEPNNSASTATDLRGSAGWHRYVGRLSEYDDVDVYNVKIPAGYDALLVDLLVHQPDRAIRHFANATPNSFQSKLGTIHYYSGFGLSHNFYKTFLLTHQGGPDGGNLVRMSVKDSDVDVFLEMNLVYNQAILDRGYKDDLNVPYSICWHPVAQTSDFYARPILTLGSLERARRSFQRGRTTKFRGTATHPIQRGIDVFSGIAGGVWSFGPFEMTIPRKEISKLRGRHYILRITASTGDATATKVVKLRLPAPR